MEGRIDWDTLRFLEPREYYKSVAIENYAFLTWVAAVVGIMMRVFVDYKRVTGQIIPFDYTFYSIGAFIDPLMFIALGVLSLLYVIVALTDIEGPLVLLRIFGGFVGANWIQTGIFVYNVNVSAPGGADPNFSERFGSSLFAGIPPEIQLLLIVPALYILYFHTIR